MQNNNTRCLLYPPTYTFTNCSLRSSRRRRRPNSRNNMELLVGFHGGSLAEAVQRQGHHHPVPRAPALLPARASPPERGKAHLGEGHGHEDSSQRQVRGFEDEEDSVTEEASDCVRVFGYVFRLCVWLDTVRFSFFLAHIQTCSFLCSCLFYQLLRGCFRFGG